MRFARLASLLLLLPACALFTTRGPGSNVTRAPRCTGSQTLPATDAVIAVIAGGGGLAMMLVSECDSDGGCAPPLENGLVIGAALMLAVSMPAMLSSTIGFDRVKRCRVAHGAWERRVELERQRAEEEAELRKEAERLRNLPDKGAECADRIEGVPSSGLCRRPYVCREGVCVEKPAKPEPPSEQPPDDDAEGGAGDEQDRGQ
jgi:hypothetical protein